MEQKERTYITLAQFLKLKGLAATGGEAKHMIQETRILVNGEEEKRRGRKLYPGDRVSVGDRVLIV